MKNKLLGILTAAVCAPVLCSTVLCSSAYAAVPEELAAALELEIAGGEHVVDARAILPIYNADLREFVDTGKFTFTQSMVDGKPEYLADAYDKNGPYANTDYKDPDFVGNYFFTYDGTKAEVSGFSSMEKGQCRISQLINNGKLPAMLSQRGFDVTNAEYKIVCIDWLGYAVYANNGTDEAFYTLDLKSDSNVTRIYFVDDDFKAWAVAMVNDEPLPGMGAGDNYWFGGADAHPPEGGADVNPPQGGAGDNPTTGGSLAVEKIVCAAALAALGTGAVVFRRKRGR